MIRLTITACMMACVAVVAGCGGGSSSSPTPAAPVFGNTTTFKFKTITTATGDLLGGAVQKGPFAAKQLNYSTVTIPVFRHVTSAFSGPIAVATDGTNQYVTNFLSHNIVKIDPSGVVTRFAGVGSPGFDNRTTAARLTVFNSPAAITTDATGTTFYVADFGNHAIRKIDPAGRVSVLAGTGIAGSEDTSFGVVARFNQPTGVTFIDGRVYVVDSGNHTIRVITIDTSTGSPIAKVSTMAGFPGVSGSVDGERTAARFNLPANITTDGRNLYVTDFGNRTVRRISPDGVVETIAGRAGVPGTDDGPKGTSLFNRPNGITTDGINLYVTDNVARTVRRIELSSGNFITTTISSGIITPIGITTNGFGLFVAPRNGDTISRIK